MAWIEAVNGAEEWSEAVNRAEEWSEAVNRAEEWLCLDCLSRWVYHGKDSLWCGGNRQLVSEFLCV